MTLPLQTAYRKAALDPYAIISIQIKLPIFPPKSNGKLAFRQADSESERER